MFTKPLQYIITKKAFKKAYEDINKNSSGLDEVSFIEFEKDFNTNIQNLIDNIIQNKYIPEPIRKIEIDKSNSDETRPIGLSSIKDKLVQKVIYNDINSYFDRTFSSNSFAYRPFVSTINALDKVSLYLKQENFIILKTDIDNFFESIDHNILLKILDSHIEDKSITRLISLFLQIGAFDDTQYSSHDVGVYQGDILSPLLSNIYLDTMDKYLQNQNIPFVRFADDFILLFKEKKEAGYTLKDLKEFLKLDLKLKLEKEKTYITHINDGFTFLGVHFEGKTKTVDNERFQRSLSKLHKLAKDKSGFAKYIEDLNSYLTGLKNYYLKIITKNTTQRDLLKENFIDSISHKVFLSKKNKSITTKKEFRILLEQIRFDILFEDMANKYIELIVAKGYEKYVSSKTYKEPLSKINKKKNTYSKKFANDSTLHISTPGMFIGISKNKFTIKQYGKVQNTYPFDKITRIILEGKGYTLSSDVIKKCAQNSITIDFIDRDALPYASLITYKSTISQMVHKQSLIVNTSLQLTLAKEFIRGKVKNQINYIKYLDKYHKILNNNIIKMETILKQSKNAKTINEVMGYEGSISSIYWDSLRLILEVPFEKRITLGAKDIVNSSLNYGYAILYGKVQHSLVHAGLSLNISFLHAFDNKKPTLTFDMIEEFRTFIVDRTIISMLNKDEPIKLDKDGLLTKSSRQLISKNIKEKLGSYTMWKKVSTKVENIIMMQCYNLASTVRNPENKYKAFIGKF